MAWLWLFISGLFEIVGVAGFERLTRRRYISGLLLAVGGFAVGLSCLRIAMADIPIAVAYSVFTGIGTVGSTLLGIALWNDSARPARLLCIAAVIVAVLGLKITV